MTWIAWKMLIGNKAKYLGIIFGVAFASLLIAQQSSIFCGLMLMTTSQIQDVKGADIWVMDRNVQFVDDIKPLSDDDLMRVRGVPGVEWAVKFYKGLARARLDDGAFQQVILLGVDDGTMVGRPQEMIIGSWDDLRRNEALIIDDAGYHQLWPGEPYKIGREFEMNDHRGVHRRRVQSVAHVSNLSDCLHPLYPGHSIRPGRTQSDVVRVGPTAAWRAGSGSV